MKRRSFLQVIGAGALGTGLGYAFGKFSRSPQAKLIPYLVPPEDVLPGVGTYYASLCNQCSAGCGTIVKVMEGRAKKIEGNPLHPVNEGGLCGRGQSAVQTLYNPARISSPMKRTGDRGTGKYEAISWDEAIKTLSGKLSGNVEILSTPLKGHLKELAGKFASSLGGATLTEYELYQNTNLGAANKATLGLDTAPHYDIANTNYLLSFGADFSTSWLSPVKQQKEYGEMRQGRKNTRGKVVQVEPKMTRSGAAADEWVPAKPGSEALLALAIGYSILDHGYYKGGNADEWKEVLKGYSPHDVAPLADVTEKRINELAHDFTHSGPSLAIGGDGIGSYTNGVSGLVAVNVLNHLAGNIGKKGGLIPNPETLLGGGKRAATNSDITGLIKRAGGGKVDTLIVSNANPVFTTPKAAGTAEAIKKVPFIASLSSFMDETTAYADLILPQNTALEDWGDDFTEVSVGYELVTMQQPAVSPFFDTRSLGDILIELGGAAGKGGTLPTSTFAEYIKSSWEARYNATSTLRSSAPRFDLFWNKLLEAGVWGAEGRTGKKVGAIKPADLKKHLPKGTAKFAGDEGEYPLHLDLFAQNGHFDGRGANIPWLQELPDPITTVVWGTWVEMNPKTAEEIGVGMGDTVTVTSPAGSFEAGVFLFQGVRPDTVSVPVGQGHSSFGDLANDRGVNPIEILPAESSGSTFALNSTRVKVAKSRKTKKFVKIAASENEYGRDIIKTISKAEFRRVKKEVI